MTWFDDLTPDEQKAALHRLHTPHGRRVFEHAGTDEKDAPYAAWLAAIDETCLTAYGVSIFDLADFMWRDLFMDGSSPAEALDAAHDEGIFS